MPTLPFIQDTHLQGIYAAPDYSFLSGQVQRANQQYEEGLHQVESDYSAVLTAEPTDQGNIQKKGEYVKQFQEGLKQLAGSNLSLPKNQAQAEKIMAPFWQDSILLQDIAKTKKYNTQVQKAYSVRDSKDPDVSSTFDQRSVDLLNYQLNRLKNANRNPDEYKDIEIDDWTSVKKVNENLTANRVKDEFGVTKDILDGYGNKITQTNGIATKPAFKNYADGVIGTEYEAQYKMFGKLEKEKQIAQYMSINPGSSRQDASTALFTDTHKDLIKTYNNRRTEYDYNIDTQQSLLNEIEKQVAKNPNQLLTPAQQHYKDALETDIANLSGRRKDIDNTLIKLNSEDGLKTTVKYPEYALGQQFRNYDIDKWADKEARNETIKIDEDKSYWNKQTLNKDYAQIGVTDRHNKAEEKIQGYNAESTRMGVNNDILKTRLEHPFSFGIDGTFTGTNPLGATPGGAAVDQEFHLSGIDEANLKRDILKNKVVNSVYGNNGLASMMLLKIPENMASSDDVLGFKNVMNKYMNGEVIEEKGPDGNPVYRGISQQDKAQYDKVVSFLNNEGYKTSSLGDTHKAFLKYVGKYVDTHKAADAIDPTDYNKIRSTYKSMKDYSDALDNDNLQREKNMAVMLANDKGAFAAINRGDRLINESDVIREAGLPAAFNLIDEQGRQVSIPSEKLAHDFLTKPFQYSATNNADRGSLDALESRAAIYVDGKKYFIPRGPLAQFPDRTVFNEVTPQQHAIQRMVSTWGQNNSDLLQKKKTLIDNAVKGTSLYADIGKVGEGYNIPHGKEDAGAKALREDVQPGQFKTMYTLNTTETAATPPQVLDANLQKAVVQIVNKEDFTNFLGINHRYVTSSITGNPGVILSFDDLSGIEDKKLADGYKKLSGKKIFVEFSPTHGAYYNKFYPIVSDYSWHPLNQPGGKIESDPTENSILGGDYKITNDGADYALTGHVKSFDSKTGKDSIQRVYLPIPKAEQLPDKAVQYARDYWNKKATDYTNTKDLYWKNKLANQ